MVRIVLKCLKEGAKVAGIALLIAIGIITGFGGFILIPNVVDMWLGHGIMGAIVLVSAWVAWAGFCFGVIGCVFDNAGR